MSLIEASEDSTPSTAPIETLVVSEESARESRSARTPLSASVARACPLSAMSATISAVSLNWEEAPHHQKACPMLT